jgi:hypothetical protein
MVWILGSTYLLRWERLPLFGHHIFAEMIMCVSIKMFLLCRSSTGAQAAMPHLWSPLQRVEHRDLFMEVSTWLEDTVSDISFISK